MATIRKRGLHQWQAQIRRSGYPNETKTFNISAEAEAWARMTESEMDRGVFVSLAEAERTTLREALARYEQEISRMKKGAKQEIVRIRYWMNHELAIRSLAKIRSVELAKWCDSESQREVQSEMQA